MDVATGDLIPHELAGVTVFQRKSDGYFNASAMCQAAGKLVADYLRLDVTKGLMKTAESDMGIPISLLVESNRSGPYANRGTWIHPDLAGNLAQWLSPQIAWKVSKWIREWATAGKIQQPSPALTMESLCRAYLNLQENSTKALENVQQQVEVNLARQSRRPPR